MESLALLESMRVIPDPDRPATATLCPIRFIRHYGAKLDDRTTVYGRTQVCRVGAGDGRKAGSRYERVAKVPIVRLRKDGQAFSPNNRYAVITADGREQTVLSLARRAPRLWVDVERKTVYQTINGPVTVVRRRAELDDMDESTRVEVKGLYLPLTARQRPSVPERLGADGIIRPIHAPASYPRSK